MVKKVAIFIAALVMTACSQYESWNANFIGINRSFAKVIVIVDGIELGALLPTATANFVTTINSGRSSGSVTSPSSNRTSTVSVVFRNTMNGLMSRPIFCTAGERLKTTIVYDSVGDSDRPSCYTTN